jgi:hypothetical protein
VAHFKSAWLGLVSLLVVAGAVAQEKQEVKKEGKADRETTAVVSFREHIFPIVKKNCLPCHASAEENMSELSLDSYALLKQGGQHGVPVVPGKAGESLLMKKLGELPPFGQRMPLNSRKKVKEGKAKWLTDEEVRTIGTWVDQGAKDN